MSFSSSFGFCIVGSFFFAFFNRSRMLLAVVVLDPIWFVWYAADIFYVGLKKKHDGTHTTTRLEQHIIVPAQRIRLGETAGDTRVDTQVFGVGQKQGRFH